MYYFQFAKTNLAISFTSLVLFLTCFYGCNKDPIVVSTITNPPLTIHISNVLDIRASDVSNKRYSFKRKIEYIDRITKLVLDSFIISMENTDTTVSIQSAINHKNFNGSFIIESGSEQFLNMNFKKGVAIKPIGINESINLHNYKSNLVNTCKVSLIHGCVSNAIDNMGVFEYAACLYSAPSCYALLWAGCSFNYCITGEQR